MAGKGGENAKQEEEEEEEDDDEEDEDEEGGGEAEGEGSYFGYSLPPLPPLTPLHFTSFLLSPPSFLPPLE